MKNKYKLLQILTEASDFAPSKNAHLGTADATYPVQEAFKKAGIDMNQEIMVLEMEHVRHSVKEKPSTGKASDIASSLEDLRAGAIEKIEADPDLDMETLEEDGMLLLYGYENHVVLEEDIPEGYEYLLCVSLPLDLPTDYIILQKKSEVSELKEEEMFDGVPGINIDDNIPSSKTAGISIYLLDASSAADTYYFGILDGEGNKKTVSVEVAGGPVNVDDIEKGVVPHEVASDIADYINNEVKSLEEVKEEEENEINWDEDIIYTGTNDDGVKTFTPLAQYKKSQHHSALYPMQEAFKQAGISMGEEITVITHGPFVGYQDKEEEVTTGKASRIAESLEYDRLEAIEEAKEYFDSEEEWDELKHDIDVAPQYDYTSTGDLFGLYDVPEGYENVLTFYTGIEDTAVDNAILKRKPGSDNVKPFDVKQLKSEKKKVNEVKMKNNNFDLKKFLIENKLTSNSRKLIDENSSLKENMTWKDLKPHWEAAAKEVNPKQFLDARPTRYRDTRKGGYRIKFINVGWSGYEPLYKNLVKRLNKADGGGWEVKNIGGWWGDGSGWQVVKFYPNREVDGDSREINETETEDFAPSPNAHLGVDQATYSVQKAFKKAGVNMNKPVKIFYHEGIAYWQSEKQYEEDPKVLVKELEEKRLKEFKDHPNSTAIVYEYANYTVFPSDMPEDYEYKLSFFYGEAYTYSIVQKK